MRAVAHPDLELSGTTLLDTELGTKYFLTPDAAWLFARLRHEPRIEDLVPAVARAQRITHAEAKQAVYTLLGLLDNFGGVRVLWEGSFDGHLRFKTRSVWRRRYPGNAAGFMCSMARAYGLGTVGVTIIFLWCRLVLGPAFPALWPAVPGLLLATCAFHEAGHALGARAAKAPFVFLARPGFAAIMYRRPGNRQARCIALCGPLAAALFCGAMMLVLEPPPIRYLFAAGGLIHVCSLLPFLADGRTLWRNI